MNPTLMTPSTDTFIPLAEPLLTPSAWTYVKDALDSGWVSSVGPYVDRFEADFANYFGVARTVSTVNGTAALHVALILAGVEAGDEVIVPAMTFIATINAIRYVGAIPVFVDSLPGHWNADVSLLESLITPKTKAIMAVHLYGDPAQIDVMAAVAEKHGLWLIEDAAEALGATFNNQYCGAIGRIGCLSFNGNKTLTTGGGGLLISTEKALMDRAHYLINQAKDDALTFAHGEVGYNYRQTNLQAALGVSQLEALPTFLAKRIAIANRYHQAFQGHPGIVVFDPLPNTKSSHWLSCIALNAEAYPHKVGLDLVRLLQAQNIQARPFFKPGHEQKPFQPFVRGPLPYASHWHQYGINLPSSCSLTEADQTRVIETVLAVLETWA